MIPRRVRFAILLTFVCHGLFIITARYRLSYDAYVHMFFADHYRSNWWALWEPRWYTGFEVVSYPPLVHQLIALLSFPFGVEFGFAIFLLLVLTAFPLAVFAYARIFAGRTVAGYAALACAVLPSIYLSAHTFGQLPTLTALLFSLFALAALAAYLKDGHWLDGALTVALIAATTAAHHATLIFLFGGALMIMFHKLIATQNSLRALSFRLIAVGLPSALAALIVIWPFWQWGLAQQMQTPIDHLSRHNFLLDPFAQVIFFWPMYGPLVPVIPFAIGSIRQRRTFAPVVFFILLFLLGLGGTTPLPRWMFGPAWEWLTYDRFALWASIVLLPFFGEAFIRLRKGLPIFLQRFRSRKVNAGAIYKTLTLITFPLFGLIVGIVVLLSSILPTQPKALDMQPVVNFLKQDDRSQWRYVTFGFGDQLALLSRLTDATTIDGSYHTARTLPELRASGIGQIDTAYWIQNGLAALEPVLKKSGERGVRWGFVYNKPDYYIPLLKRLGWVKLTTLPNGVQVFENPSAILPEPSTPPVPENPFAEFSWGFFPLLAFSFTLVLSFSKFHPFHKQPPNIPKLANAINAPEEAAMDKYQKNQPL
jgi:hypothetical protein